VRYIDIGGSGLRGSAVSLGSMRIDALSQSEVADLIEATFSAEHSRPGTRFTGRLATSSRNPDVT
jgi:hypothetical protein